MEEETSYVKHDTHKTRRGTLTFLFPESGEVSCSMKVLRDERYFCAEEKGPLFSLSLFFFFFLSYLFIYFSSIFFSGLIFFSPLPTLLLLGVALTVHKNKSL